ELWWHGGLSEVLRPRWPAGPPRPEPRAPKVPVLRPDDALPAWAYARPSQRPRRRAGSHGRSGRRRPLRDRPGSQKAVHRHGSDAGSYDRNRQNDARSRHGSGRRRELMDMRRESGRLTTLLVGAALVVGSASAGGEATRASVSIKQVSVTP